MLNNIIHFLFLNSFFFSFECRDAYDDVMLMNQKMTHLLIFLNQCLCII